MPLDEYRRKRDFTKSPEPAGAEATPSQRHAPRYFCVQKHLASHLHYDLRLEHDGVLLSWAVPKGPSIDTRDKRLAMQTEDHPVEYGSFEGVIPEGYGAGVVMLWDYGTWTPESPDVGAALAKGDLKFRLDGYKLKGSWALVRTRGYGDSGKPSWLLIKHRDEWAGPIAITEFAPLSVKTPDADLADILATDTPALWHSHPPAKSGDTGKLFQRIIATALELRAARHADPATRRMPAAAAADALEPPAPAPKRRATPAPETGRRPARARKTAARRSK
ncbi:MAG: DNA polymerase ligase N-terminal domain-containing protein [Vicinamibacterales bacterium]